MTPCRLLTPEEHRAADDARIRLANTRADGKGASMVEITGPCVMWFCPWYFDPFDDEDAPTRQRCMEAITRGEKQNFLSRFYWEDWSATRPPISVICPNGKDWCVDQVSTNGEGWKVTGDAPIITCAPSILVPGYHGFLQKGIFTPNL